MKKHKICAMINLAGDRDSLLPLCENRPIAALPFGCRYRIIDFMLSSVSHANIDSVALFIKESGRSIYDHIRSGREWNLDSSIKGGIFTFSQQVWKFYDYLHHEKADDYYANHRQFMDKSNGDYVVIMGGEVIQNVDIDAIRRHHNTKEAEITVVYKNVEGSYLKHNLRDEQLKFDETGSLIGYEAIDIESSKVPTSTDVYFMSIDLLNEIFNRAMNDLIYEDVSSVIRWYLFDYKVSAFEYTGYVAFVDSIASYYNANMAMLNANNYNSLFYSSLSVITRSKSGVPTYYATNVVVKNSQIATGCSIYGDVENSLISRKVTVGESASVKNSLILQGVKIGEGAVLEYVVADKGVVIEPGVRLIGTADNLLILEKNQRVTQEI